MKTLFANKYFWITLIILGINIPLKMIEGQIEDRVQQRDVARQSVSQSWTGEQELLAGVLTIPYEEKISVQSISGFQSQPGEHFQWEKRELIVIAEQLNLDAALSNQSLNKGIYTVPVYTAEVNLDGRLDLNQLHQLQENQTIRLSGKPRISFGLSDSRGLLGVPEISVENKLLEMLPGSALEYYGAGFHAELTNDLSALKQVAFSAHFRVNGMQALTFIGAAKDNLMSAHSDWPHPEFRGAFFPLKRQVDDKGYSASWRTGIFSTNMFSLLQRCRDGDCRGLQESGFGVAHIQPVDIYLQSLRSVKYGLLIVLVTFSIFVIYEITNRRVAIHPMSYLLIGAALAIFFLLLVALSEHLSFVISYWLASLACAGLIAVYIASQSRSLRNGWSMMLILGGLYGSLFFIIRFEDHALLSGSLLLFLLLAIIMLVTRKLDWYQLAKN